MTSSDPAAPAWPAVGWERLTWDAGSRAPAMTRADQRRAHGSYQAAVPARLAGLDYRPSTRLAAALEDAAVELSRYDAEMASSPAPLDAVLLRPRYRPINCFPSVKRRAVTNAPRARR